MLVNMHQHLHTHTVAWGGLTLYKYPLTHHSSHAAHHRSYHSQTAEVQILYTDVCKQSKKCRSHQDFTDESKHVFLSPYLCINSLYSTLLYLYVVLLSFLQQELVAGGVPLFQWIWKMKAEEGIAGNAQEEMEAQNS